MRRDFHLPEQDVEYLEASGYAWETIKQNGNWVIIYDYPVPSGYNYNKVAAALRIDSGYPVAQVDMVYFKPHLSRLDNKPIRALALQNIRLRSMAALVKT